MQVHDFIEEALPANSGVDDRGLDDLVASFVSEAMAAQVASEGIASQSSISMDAFFAACHTSQVSMRLRLSVLCECYEALL